jgi:monoamine oxidase
MANSDIYDVAIVGAGAAGVAAARRLKRARLRTIVLEARERVGGRARTYQSPRGYPLDLGCGWLHSADQNPLCRLARGVGLTVDVTPPPWELDERERPFVQSGWAAFSAALEDFEQRLEAAARDAVDRAASDFLDPHSPWTPLINAFSTYYNGAAFDRISVHDYAAYVDSGVNWRVREGYGTLIAALAHDLPIAFAAPVRSVDHGRLLVTLDTPRGVIPAHTVIITVPTDVLAGEGLRCDPPLPDKIACAAALPLGYADKLFIALDQPELVPENGQAFGRMDRAETGNYHFRPFGRPYIEAYVGGCLARDLAKDGPRAYAGFALDELTAVLGADARRHLSPIAASAWSEEPHVRGAYSHALPGHAHVRAVLAEPVENRLFFAGEACSADAFSTAHGAYRSGIAAADAACAALSPRLAGGHARAASINTVR